MGINDLYFFKYLHRVFLRYVYFIFNHHNQYFNVKEFSENKKDDFPGTEFTDSLTKRT